MHSADEPKSVAPALLTDQLDEWHEEVLGLRQVVDQGWAKIYQGSKTGHVGLVDERRGMNRWTEKKAVNVSFLIDDLDGWFAAVKARGLFPLRGTAVSDDEAGRYRAFVGYDPRPTTWSSTCSARIR